MKKIILIALLSVGSFSHANQASPTSSAMEFTREETQTKPRGILPFLAAGGGYTGYENVGAAEGTPANLKLLGSYYFESPFVVDLGYGVNNQQFSQVRGTTLDTSKTGGIGELAARYNWQNARWQAGVVANQLYDQGKNLSADQADATFVGLQVLKEFNISASWLARLGARAMALTNNTDGQVNMYMVDLQIGWNPGAYRTSVRQTAARENPVQREPAMEEETAGQQTEQQSNYVAPARPVAANQPEPALRDVSYASLTGGTSSIIQFQTAKSSLSGQDQQKLSRVAKVLNENKDLYDRVEIRGFTDSSGSASLNQRLSEQRANQVRSALRRNGLRDVNIAAVGMGSNESTGNMSEDRRAELVFIGVKDEAKLREALSNIE